MERKYKQRGYQQDDQRAKTAPGSTKKRGSKERCSLSENARFSRGHSLLDVRHYG